MSSTSVPDDQIVAAVAAIRAEHGSCTYRALAEAAHLSITAMKYRVARLEAAGRLRSGPTAGSIRLAPGPLARFRMEWEIALDYDGAAEMNLCSSRLLHPSEYDQG
jgi:hypothetical protein